VTFNNDAIPRLSGSLVCPSTGAISGTLNFILSPGTVITLL
jgi:hypothetical protein